MGGALLAVAPHQLPPPSRGRVWEGVMGVMPDDRWVVFSIFSIGNGHAD